MSAENHAPYDRPPLSKKLWTGKPLDSIWRNTAEAGVDLRLDSRALACDPASRTVTDPIGNVHGYEKLLLATGGTPRHLPFSDDGVIYFRHVDDYPRVRALADRNARFVVIGAGFIGPEIAAALAINGCEVNMIFPATGIGAHRVGAYSKILPNQNGAPIRLINLSSWIGVAIADQESA